ncbi:MAG: hypothetical protein GY934_11365, partial [Gammaproteobacteria bacterium]|nr:hypothetical protein [Gammaproteobacteria bacterium]
MSDNERQDKVDDAPPNRGEAFASRRRVIKGLASAVPAIMTVSSGAALANGSALQCIDPQITPPAADAVCIPNTGNNTPTLPTGDHWQRAYEQNYLGDGDYADINGDNPDYPINTIDDNDLCVVYVDSNGTRV